MIDPSKSEALQTQERAAASLEDVLRIFLRQDRLDMHTALPGVVQSYDPSKLTVTVQCAIQRQIAGVGPQSVPLLVDVPVVFTGGGGFLVTFPIVAGDECLVIFSERCIDSWWSQGGVQPVAEARMHDYSDGFAIIGPRSLPRVPSGGAPMGGFSVVTAATGAPLFTVTASGVTINGTLTVTGAATLDGIGFKAHQHGGGASDGGFPVGALAAGGTNVAGKTGGAQ